MQTPLSRRRFIRICAAAAGLPALSLASKSEAATDPVTWRGTMLGAIATMEIHHPDRSEARRLIGASLAEARRLERLFSLYLKDSVLVELNRTGILVDPPAEMVDLLTISKRYAQLTGGMFDPTVQPLWSLYAAHFSKPNADPNGPPRAELDVALAHVDCKNLEISRDRIAMPRGFAVTLNGIAQGYVTDRVVDLLRAEGVAHSLVDMGEPRAIGARADGAPWEVGVADPEVVGRAAAVFPIVDRAVSTSGAYGFQFDPQGRFNHLFDPATGGCANRYRSVTTVAFDATAADAMSTAFSFMPPAEIRALMTDASIERVHLIDAQGAALDLVA
ncbi:FAD:protein FMN transferase [Bradyrhizobium sp.]|uniref:FAD:protein FMN transferase n=1 Tax=Bradyrhizobium sp. TaxID=376 RepID=UPI0023A1C77E|nr:FAD:protein FMN transferase [Bradyrhizobium sp.]MDE2375732.1 FAD:protein FMN transferase [Bradyrhizobium sp.]